MKGTRLAPHRQPNVKTMDVARRISFSVTFWTLTFVPVAAMAQLGTGGTTGATLAGTDLFLSVQKQQGVNLNEKDRALFLNQSSCQCRRPAWLRAVVLPSAAGRAALTSSSATVSMYLGSGCNSTTTIGCCLPLKDIPFSQFRFNGIEAQTSVDQLARIWSTTAGNCGVGTGSDGTGGDTGTGGTGGAGGAGGGGGTGGGSGTASTGTCNGTAFTQTLWLFIGTSGPGSMDIASASLGFSVDPEPPLSPSVAAPLGAANEALVVSWTALSAGDAADLKGYQILCTRGDSTQVFKTGTFTPSFDSCDSTATSGTWPGGPSTSFVCSDLLSAASTSARLKILENEISYGVGVTAIDNQRNASAVSPLYGEPVETKDFYSVYRHGDQQGSATGGYCSVGGLAADDSMNAALGGLMLFGLALAGMRRRPPRGQS
jgi:uncharacterized membrane protein YgcG